MEIDNNKMLHLTKWCRKIMMMMSKNMENSQQTTGAHTSCDSKKKYKKNASVVLGNTVTGLVGF